MILPIGCSRTTLPLAKNRRWSWVVMVLIATWSWVSVAPSFAQKLPAGLHDHTLPALLIDAETGLIVDANRSALAFYGYSAEQFVRQKRITEINQFSADEVRAEMAAAKAEKRNFFVFPHRLANGEVVAVEVYSSPTVIGGRTYLLSFILPESRNIQLRDELNRYQTRLEEAVAIRTSQLLKSQQETEQWYQLGQALTALIAVGLLLFLVTLWRKNQQLKAIAYEDPLTHLPNRNALSRYLTERLSQFTERRMGGEVVVGVLDLDDFDAVNLRWGSSIGDTVLQQLAERLHQNNHKVANCYWARLGGDEFAFAQVVHDENDVLTLLSEIARLVGHPFSVEGEPLTLHTSIGYTVYPEDRSNAEGLLRHAYEAVAEAKANGKGASARYNTVRRQHQLEIAQTASAVAAAITHRQLEPFWQPQVSLENGSVVGAEALVRWRHPDLGLLPPARFLPIIEQHPVIEAIGRLMLEQAVTQWFAWREAEPGWRPTVAVNLAPYHLQSPTCFEDIRTVLQRYPQFDPGCLEIEVVETTKVEEKKRIDHLIRALRELGIRVTIDDFGSGFASLSYLRDIPSDVLKIDQAYVRFLTTCEENPLIVDAVVGLGHAFHRQIVAEGVENEAIGSYMVRMGVDIAQGYAIAQPMAANELLSWQRGWRFPAAWQAWQPLRALQLTRLLAKSEIHGQVLMTLLPQLRTSDPDRAVALANHPSPFDEISATYGAPFANRFDWQQMAQAHLEWQTFVQRWVRGTEAISWETIDQSWQRFVKELIAFNRALHTL